MQSPDPLIGYDEYLELDRQAPPGVRLEYFDGVIFIDGQPYDPAWGWDRALDMAGGSLAHNRIETNLTRELSLVLRDRNCDVLSLTRIEFHGQYEVTYSRHALNTRRTHQVTIS